MKRGSDRLRRLVPGVKKEKKEEWRVLDRITGFQTIDTRPIDKQLYVPKEWYKNEATADIGRLTKPKDIDGLISNIQ
ncbi:uncharacterized protein Bfra_003100 [Botrytis fragariae]|uniref:Uncharacterized protein n=1 Tax=Botrytis fragariae TaxID=1964551 RepID=A0A8H6B017_9HELO|nr:uncharacterized protein Bfra_003100 [Botrytis fragariae]KAF5876694.1 hypothetical protein Bfra_003100 [Botrytis fragariae]